VSRQPTRSYLAIAGAIVIAGALISASLFVVLGGAKTSTITTTEISVSTIMSTNVCSSVPSISPNLHHAFEVEVNYSGPWNATLTAYSGPAAVFTQCYVGNGMGFMWLSDWNPNGSALLQVSAQKADGNSGNLELTINGETNSTTAPYGSVAVSAGP
jgi:hypothetical protein